jgi:ABC-2 type transport system ATP-binding protein
MNPDALIIADQLSKSYGEVHAVDGLSLRVASGEIYGLVGPDGAGKTTTMRLLCGALHPDRVKSGHATSIHVAGYDVARQVEHARAQIGYLPQRFSLYEDLTVMENIRFFAEVRGLSADEWLPRCMEILEFVGLADFTERRAGQLSGGMKQKLGLASALVTQPRVLLLDEPTTGVDPVTRQDFWQLLIRLVAVMPQRESKQDSSEENGSVAVLLSTPYMDEASRCNRVGFMKQGRIIAEGAPSQLRERLSGRILALRGTPLNLLRHVAKTDPDVEDVQAFGDRLHIRVRENTARMVIERLPDRIKEKSGKVEELRSVSPVLEDVFIELSTETDTEKVSGGSHE